MATEQRCWQVYLLECRTGEFYCGATGNLDRRIRLHNEGKGAKFTKYRRPVTLVIASCKLTKSEALRLEALVKKQKRHKKAAMIAQTYIDELKRVEEHE